MQLLQVHYCVLEENKHFTEDARVSSLKQTELSLLSRLSVQWSFLSTNMGVMFFSSVLLSNANFLKQFSLVGRT